MAQDVNRALTRRNLLIGGLGLAVVSVAGGYAWLMRRPFDGAALTPEQAHAMALADEIYLIDIRRPDEWAATGIGEGAVPLDMRRGDFVAALRAATQTDPERPVAMICARGVRSSQLTARLAEAGMTRLIDVPEGMLGSRAGPGWLKRNLPTYQPRQAQG